MEVIKDVSGFVLKFSAAIIICIILLTAFIGVKKKIKRPDKSPGKGNQQPQKTNKIPVIRNEPPRPRNPIPTKKNPGPGGNNSGPGSANKGAKGPAINRKK